MVYCHNCGINLQKDVNFCSNCGASQKPQLYNPNVNINYQYRMSLVSGILLLIAAILHFITGVLTLTFWSHFTSENPSLIYHYFLPIILISIIGFISGILAAIYIFLKRYYYRAIIESILLLVCIIVNIFFGVLSLLAIILAILGLTFLYVSKNEFFQSQYNPKKQK